MSYEKNFRGVCATFIQTARIEVESVLGPDMRLKFLKSPINKLSWTEQNLVKNM